MNREALVAAALDALRDRNAFALLVWTAQPPPGGYLVPRPETARALPTTNREAGVRAYVGLADSSGWTALSDSALIGEADVPARRLALTVADHVELRRDRCATEVAAARARSRSVDRVWDVADGVWLELSNPRIERLIRDWYAGSPRPCS